MRAIPNRFRMVEALLAEELADGERRLYSLRPSPFQELGAWASRHRVLGTAGGDGVVMGGRLGFQS